VVQGKNIRNAVVINNILMTILKNTILIIISGILLVLSFPNYNLVTLSYIFLVPLLISINKQNKYICFLFGFLTGMVAYSGIMYWIVPTFIAAGQSKLLGVLCLLLLSAYCSIYIGIFCIFLNLFNSIKGIYFIFSLSSIWVILEYIRTYFLSGFPWGVLGYTQWKFLSLIQISEITGVYGISFLIVFINLAIGKFVIDKIEFKNKFKYILCTSLIFLFCILYGYLRLNLFQSGNNSKSINVVCLQGNIDQYKKWDKKYQKEIINTYTMLINKSMKTNPDLIIWPESSVPGYLLNEIDLYNYIREIIKKSKCYHIIGSVVYNKSKFYNSAILFSKEGNPIEIYSKVHLVPFGETIPFKPFLSKYIKVLNELGDFTSGRDYKIFHIKGCDLGINICYESIFPEISRKITKKGAEILVNITNDAWYLRTSAAQQHFIFNIFRAIENRRTVIRCANTGITGFIDKYGRINKKTEIFSTLILEAVVNTNKFETIYTKFGDIFIFLCIFNFIISFIYANKLF